MTFWMTLRNLINTPCASLQLPIYYHTVEDGSGPLTLPTQQGAWGLGLHAVSAACTVGCREPVHCDHCPHGIGVGQRGSQEPAPTTPNFDSPDISD